MSPSRGRGAREEGRRGENKKKGGSGGSNPSVPHLITRTLTRAGRRPKWATGPRAVHGGISRTMRRKRRREKEREKKKRGKDVIAVRAVFFYLGARREEGTPEGGGGEEKRKGGENIEHPIAVDPPHLPSMFAANREGGRKEKGEGSKRRGG